jgi:deazaflavin-dependent oxidoreductase (nitroreductase family)
MAGEREAPQQGGGKPSLADVLQDLFVRTHRAVYAGSGGRIGAGIGTTRWLLLATTGRKTGQTRVVVLRYLRDGDRLAVIASNWGKPNAPAWWLNLQAHPEAAIQVGRQRMRVRARQANPEEQEQLWRRAVRDYPGFAEYQRRIERVIPVVILEPV